MELGWISKRILEDINPKLVDATKVNQWNNTSSVPQWYKPLPNKHDSAFICFVVVEFYPLISEALLNRALDFASDHVTISIDDRHTIVNAKHSPLFNNGQPWEKKNLNTLFDVTMGSYDGAETCELVGCYLLAQLQQIPKHQRRQKNLKSRSVMCSNVTTLKSLLKRTRSLTFLK